MANRCKAMFYSLLSWLPLPVLHALAWPAYLVIYYVAGYRKQVVKQNLRQAFPDRSAREITVLAKKFYLQLVQVALEIIKTPRLSAQDIKRRVRIVNPELLKTVSHDFQQPVIMLSIHQGNWEWMMHGVKLTLDIPIDPVYKPLHNKTLDEFIFQMRSQFGSRPIKMDSAARDIIRRRNEFRLFVLVADQAPIERERSHWLSFMNRAAAFYEGAESLARVTQFPVMFAQCRRTSRGHYEVEFSEVANPPHESEGHHIIESYVRLAEQAIKREPESWLWSNRRWKRQPPVAKC